MNINMNYKRKTIGLIIKLVLVFIILAIPFLLFQNFTGEVTNNANKTDSFPQGYKIITPKIPEALDFCGETVPIENFEVFERLEREFIVNTYWHSLTLLTIKRANRWFPIIEKILKENNIPEDFKYLCVTESTLLNLISPMNAVGFWQFLKDTGVQYGLEINNEVDERYHVEKSTVAACKYLQEAFNKYGSWTLAAASYNMGMNSLNEQLVRQKTNNYYNLVLGDETSRYIFRILATKEIMEAPNSYGFHLSKEELYKPFETFEIVVDTSISNLADFAFKNNINYKILKLYNPWLRENYLINKNGKKYKIKIPLEGTIEKIEERINNQP